MLKFFYRLKRRGGAVLFAVIAIMSLLIAMAVTAYFTARSAYQTVVSNYDFSQMYLSAVSVSDMMIEALTQDTYAAKDKNGYEVNKYDGLKKEVQKLKTTKGSTLVGTSTNIDGKAGDALLSAAAETPVESGVLDAVKVEITHKDNFAEKDGITGAATGLTIYVFEIKTTAYYRDNTITVTDMVLNKAGKSTPPSNATPFNTFFTATGQKLAGTKVDKDHTRVVTIKAHQISDNAYFENDWTVFPNGNNNDFLGGITAAGSVYLDKFTCHIPSATSTSRHDWYIGGDLATGANSNDLDLKNNNLYVKNDLILGGSGFTVTAGDIYVMGDLYLCSSGTVNINANIYVKGNIYYGADEDIQGRINTVGSYSGTYLGLNTTGVLKVQSGKTFKINGTHTPTDSNSTTDSGKWDPGSVSVPVSSITANMKDDKYEEKVTTTSLDSAVSSKTKTTTFETYTAKEETLKNEVTINLDEMDGLLPPSDAKSWEELMKLQNDTGKGFEEKKTGGFNYGPYNQWVGDGTYLFTQSASGTGVTYKKIVIDNTTGATLYEEECFIDKSGNMIVTYDDGTTAWRTATGAVYEMTDGTQITATKTTSGVTIDIPYNDDGYLLGLDLGSYNKTNLTYNFDVPDKGKTMPVVLKANFNDGSSTASDSEGNNAFSWRQGDTGDGCESKVQVTGKGNVMFELGNYVTGTENISDSQESKYKSDDVGKYVPYSPETKTITAEDGTKVEMVDFSDLQINVETAKYFVCQKETVGTEKQVDKVSGKWQDTDDGKGINKTFNSMLKSGTSTPDTDYENRVMIVSNKNGGVAIDGARINNTICGYIYAPNGIYDNASGGGNSPVFGGLIASAYSTNLSFFTYCEPQPSVISQLLGSMTQYTPSAPSSTPADGYWIMSGVGKNYNG